MTEDFEQWLQARYRSTTVDLTLREVRRAARQWHEDGELPEAVHGSLRRFATYLRETNRAPKDNIEFQHAVKSHPELTDVRKVRAQGRRRKKPAQSFRPEDWTALSDTIVKDKTPVGVVLLLMAATGHRIGDILRIHRRDLDEAKRTGVLLLERKGGDMLEVPLDGARAAWNRLDRLWKGAPDDQVCDWVCPECTGGPGAGQGAYKRVQRRIKALGEDLGLQGRVHLHRMRRTVGVRALKLTKDVHLVSQLLGHKSVSSTEEYVDELRRDDLADLQKKLRDEE